MVIRSFVQMSVWLTLGFWCAYSPRQEEDKRGGFQLDELMFHGGGIKTDEAPNRTPLRRIRS